ncbi:MULTISPECIES: hypothetical protein [Pseudomonas]|jgi:hypothetical protein|uniref:hypothetical protein n=1 Tax=Pseudomonas TaxID=286 RepID=UPI0032E4BB1B
MNDMQVLVFGLKKKAVAAQIQRTILPRSAQVQFRRDSEKKDTPPIHNNSIDSHMLKQARNEDCSVCLCCLDT